MTLSLTDQQRAFLLHGTRTGKLATTRKDGRPHVVPIWFVLHGDEIVFNTGAATIKGRNIARDARVTLCVDDERPPFSFLMLEGIATTSDDLDAMLPWSIKIGGRYMGADKAEQFGKRNAVPGELLVRVTPTNVVFVKDLAD